MDYAQILQEASCSPHLNLLICLVFFNTPGSILPVGVYWSILNRELLNIFSDTTIQYSYQTRVVTLLMTASPNGAVFFVKLLTFSLAQKYVSGIVQVLCFETNKQIEPTLQHVF